ncbi:UNKNOWN [Stylonychia lemnae]|uniref:Uncharacterized protein n=1 Tax=Stylonychia lemnae TaxID=5949 RepID=A0A078ABQ5_STYLE|nr:UNKNOWN [Stylonychia lemnae]|eukprot:CDW79301.1 UNKNOWN [Stylonychia lemnae]
MAWITANAQRQNSCNVNCALQCTEAREINFEDIDGCLQICRCLSEFQYEIMRQKPRDETGKYIPIQREQRITEVLNDLEQAEVNFLCLDHCIDYTQFAQTCFKNCEGTLTKFMLDGEYQRVLTTDFKINEQHTEGIVFLVMFYVLGGVIIGGTLFWVCKAIKKSIRHKNQKNKHKRDKKRNIKKKRFASGQEESGDFLAYNDKHSQIQPFLPKVSVHSLDA